MNELLKKAIEEIMEKNYHHKNSEGIYSIDIYADYRDSLEKMLSLKSAKKVLKMCVKNSTLNSD